MCGVFVGLWVYVCVCVSISKFRNCTAIWVAFSPIIPYSFTTSLLSFNLLHGIFDIYRIYWLAKTLSFSSPFWTLSDRFLSPYRYIVCHFLKPTHLNLEDGGSMFNPNVRTEVPQYLDNINQKPRAVLSCCCLVLKLSFKLQFLFFTCHSICSVKSTANLTSSHWGRQLHSLFSFSRSVTNIAVSKIEVHH